MRSLVPILLVTFGVACTAKESGTTAKSDMTSTTASSSTETAISSTETAVAPEVNPPGKGVVIKYTSNSDPSAVTNKQVRLENVTYIFYENGKEAMLTMSAPLGADNADQWNRMANSFRWL